MEVIERLVADRSDRPATEQISLIAERFMFLKRRWRGVAEDGTEFGFDLDSRLHHGCVFYRNDVADYVIWQQEELVYQVAFESADFAALAGWKIGNLHFPVQIMERCLRVTHDPAILQLFERENWPYEEVAVVFNPLRVMPHAS